METALRMVIHLRLESFGRVCRRAYEAEWAAVAERPTPAGRHSEMITTKRPFAACGKLTLPLDESIQNTGSAPV
jgi:hypothetical protein